MRATLVFAVMGCLVVGCGKKDENKPSEPPAAAPEVSSTAYFATVREARVAVVAGAESVYTNFILENQEAACKHLGTVEVASKLLRYLTSSRQTSEEWRSTLMNIEADAGLLSSYVCFGKMKLSDVKTNAERLNTEAKNLQTL